MDIVAEIVADSPQLRETIKTKQSQTITIQSKPTKTFEEN
jgi:hypothetical protein